MLFEHAGHRPQIDSTAWIAPDATICGNVYVGPGSRVLYGARIVGESGGLIQIGRGVTVMENAVIRATAKHACTIGDHCLVGPNAPCVGASLDHEVFVATSAAIFHGSEIRTGRGSTTSCDGAFAHGHSARSVCSHRMDRGRRSGSFFLPIATTRSGQLQKPLNFPEWGLWVFS